MNGASAPKALPSHPVADLFPLMDREQFTGLVEDILEHGQREPIVMHNGQILDGRNRWLACESLGIDPITKELEAGIDPLHFALSANLHRRHLTVGQRAMLAAQIAHLHVGRPNNSKKIDDYVSAERAASMMGISRPQVFHGKTVLEHGTEEEKAQVRSGEVNVSTQATVIRKRNKEGKVVALRPGARAGEGMKLPEGETPETIARKAIAMHVTERSMDKIAEQLGVARANLRPWIDIVHIADRTDLGPRDSELAQIALKQMNERIHKVEEVFNRVRTIATRLWGDGRRDGTRAEREAARLDQFQRQLASISGGCWNAELMEVPHLSREQIRDVLEELKLAHDRLKMLEGKLKEIYA